MQLTGEDSPVPDYHLKLATALGGIYFFYMSERLLKIVMKRNKVGLIIFTIILDCMCIGRVCNKKKTSF